MAIRIARQRISAHFRILTPMFLGGSSPEAACNYIRPQSVRGALAFWWRALELPKLLASVSMADALIALRNRERDLFGSTDAQAAFLLSVRQGGPLESVRCPMRVDCDAGQKSAGKVVGDGARYLGYGVMQAFDDPRKNKKQGDLLRSAICPGQTFELVITVRETSARRSVGAIAELIEAVRLLGLFGGLGARVRRGYGSLALTELNSDRPAPDLTDALRPVPTTVEMFAEERDRIRQAVRASRIANMPITGFGDGMRVELGRGYASWHEALDALGTSFVRYRGWGYRGQFGSVKCKQNFSDDKDWYHRHEQTTQHALDADPYVPARTEFGLPHNYSNVLGVKGVGKVERRASPLLLTVKKVGTNYHPLGIHLPTKFIDQDAVSVRSGNRTSKKAYPGKPSVISDFLDTAFGRLTPNSNPADPWLGQALPERR